MASNKTPAIKKTNNEIGKIAVSKIPNNRKKEPKTVTLDSNSENKEENSLLNSVQILLRFHGIERSHGSIRDLADISDGTFDFKDAVSAFQNLEFEFNATLSQTTLCA